MAALFEGVDGDVPLEQGDGGFGLPQVLAQALVVLFEVLQLLLESLHRFRVAAVAVDAGTELRLKVGVSVGEEPAFDAGFVGEGLDGELAVGADRRAVEEPGHGVADGGPLRWCGHSWAPAWWASMRA
jgi:hypothetical protein